MSSPSTARPPCLKHALAHAFPPFGLHLVLSLLIFQLFALAAHVSVHLFGAVLGLFLVEAGEGVTRKRSSSRSSLILVHPSSTRPSLHLLRYCNRSTVRSRSRLPRQSRTFPLLWTLCLLLLPAAAALEVIRGLQLLPHTPNPLSDSTCHRCRRCKQTQRACCFLRRHYCHHRRYLHYLWAFHPREVCT